MKGYWAIVLGLVLVATVFTFSISMSPVYATTGTLTNNTPGSVDRSVDTRTVTFTTAEIPAGESISDVNITVDFIKSGTTCPSTSGFPFNPEISMSLQSPAGTIVNLIFDQTPGPSTYRQTGQAGRVVVTFDDSAAALVGTTNSGTPTSGTFRPAQPLSAFNNELPQGIWIFTFGDDVGLDPLCFNQFDLTLVSITLKTPSGGGNHEPPTIGKNYAGTKQIVTNGICIDAQCWTVTDNFHMDFELVQMLTSPHTISNTIFCNQGVQECNYVGIAFTTKDFDFNDPVMMVEAKKTNGEWAIGWYDPQDFIQDPDDDIPGEIIFTAQISDDNFLLTSFTIVFKNKDTGQLVIGIQVRDVELGVRTFWFNEGVEFKDSDAYPSILTEFEESLEINSLCLNEDPTYRYSCAFAENRERAIQTAEETLRQIMNNEYTYK